MWYIIELMYTYLSSFSFENYLSMKTFIGTGGTKSLIKENVIEKAFSYNNAPSSERYFCCHEREGEKGSTIIYPYIAGM